ncbi:DUF2188 domain-containing protein [Salisediminibacterium halotolerans]|uniref:DUF2188 domain-containing protein n=1 Tax=Salisediminibacterium halotolerans TaxID=517425 RepID=UPI000EADFB9A|nr:DUF2188 domain-containing protein [Salisediminibacterium halotolerans]RLJ74381.1 uncharacterized protein DUF2188 [Actinophytocola xinjiangensis]RPE87526.1 uncharacterized protein DUF2188 [Salisediminibacterium halotolerans]TWG35218.1 uncharacterized protein DUF2188 [Salisediminibacterium halotolerans]GEL08151.1 hypothetical protein SHA02_15670 [Salisediminibacterium halotolerans]
MKEFTVRPNKDADTWFVKTEDAVPSHEYDKMDEAINAAKNLGEENKPCKVLIYDHHNELAEELTFD